MSKSLLGVIIVLLCLLVAVLALVIVVDPIGTAVANFSYFGGATAQERGFERMATVRDLKKDELERFFQHCRRDLSVLVQTVGLLQETGALDPQREDFGTFLDQYVEETGYYDLFLIRPDGYCFYTAAKEADYQTNFVDGKYNQSNLGSLVRKTLDTKQFGFADYAPYAPSSGEPAAFIAEPLVRDGQVELLVVLQMPLDSINQIVQSRYGMGLSGEVYLVGPDFRMRSDSFLDNTNHSVVASFAHDNLAKSDMIADALTGKTSVVIGDDYTRQYTGVSNFCVSAYTPVDVYGVTWAVIAEIDVAEVLQ